VKPHAILFGAIPARIVANNQCPVLQTEQVNNRGEHRLLRSDRSSRLDHRFYQRPRIAATRSRLPLARDALASNLKFLTPKPASNTHGDL
jgi:hypothetical protein